MTYIIGTSFIVQRRELRPGFTSSAQKTQPVNTILPPGRYTVNYIRIKPDGVTYTFVDDNFQRIEVDFKSTTEADNFISSCRGEQIPDYTKVYKNLS